jgi:hypothetical protein
MYREWDNGATVRVKGDTFFYEKDKIIIRIISMVELLQV